jgi:hypothetical protein
MEKETLKSLRAKAKDLRSKVSSAPLSKATPDQLRSEILMLERAVKAEEKAKEKKALKEASKPLEKKKITTQAPVVSQKPKSDSDAREKELARREKELLKREKMLLKPKQDLRAEMSDTDDSDYC